MGKNKKNGKEAIVKEEKRIRRRKSGYKEWWDRGCTKKKKGSKNIQEMEEREDKQGRLYGGEKES